LHTYGWRGRFTKLEYLILNQDFPLRTANGALLFEHRLDFRVCPSRRKPEGSSLVRFSQMSVPRVPPFFASDTTMTNGQFDCGKWGSFVPLIGEQGWAEDGTRSATNHVPGHARGEDAVGDDCRTTATGIEPNSYSAPNHPLQVGSDNAA
jgi:hypothetical protein